MKMTITNKLTILILCFAAFVMASYSIVFYFVSHEKVKIAAGLELVGCASITSGLITEEVLAKIVKGDKNALKEARASVDWIVDSKSIFKSALIVDRNGKVLVADKRILEEGTKEGDLFYVEKDLLDKAAHAVHTAHGSHDTYTDIYTFNGKNRMAGYAPIKNNLGIEAFMVIEFDESIIKERTVDNVLPAIRIGWIFPILGAFVTYMIFRKSVRPLVRMSKEVDLIAQGDLSFEPTIVNSKDEIGSLSQSIQGMAKSLADVLGKVNETGEQLTKSSNLLHKEVTLNLNSTRQIGNDIEALNEGAKNQLFQTKESAAAMDEISSQVIHVAKNSDIMKQSTTSTAQAIQEMANSIEQVSKGSEHASKLAEEVQKDAINGKGHVDHSKEEMVEIAKIIEKASNVMQNLGRSSQEIGRIVEVIDGIAEQTNLLALNAAIEAARAGEHGKGFSVVADEVKNLAERSANATKEIAHLIKGIQAETNQAVEAIEVGSEKVNEGNRLAESASFAIEQIVQGVKQISNELSQISFTTSEQAKQSNSVVKDISTLEEQVNQVAKATQEQTIGVNEITKAIGKIAEISQTSTQQLQDVVQSSQEGEQAIETISDSAKALEELSDELQEIVGNFKLKK